jgi:hypothetical protein
MLIETNRVFVGSLEEKEKDRKSFGGRQESA